MHALIRMMAMSTVAVIAIGATQAYAAGEKELSEATIHAFYEELPILFKKPYEEFTQAYSGRLSKDLVFTNQTTIAMEGQEPVQTPLNTMTRDQLLGGMEQAYKSSQSATLASTITNIKIGADGKTATLDSVATITGMTFPTTDNSPMTANSVEKCSDELVLTDGVGIQIAKSTCTASVQLKQPAAAQ